MFGVYFGRYLLASGALNRAQYDEIIAANRTARLKLGVIAVAQGFMTDKQAEEVNQIQVMEDKRFGDIAIDKGYITEEQLGIILKKQGDSYLLFVQALKDRSIMNDEEIAKALVGFKKVNGFTDFEMDAIKSGDVNRIIPIFTSNRECPVEVRDYIALMARNVVRFIDNKVRFGYLEKINSYMAEAISIQELKGDYNFLVGIGTDGDKEGLRLAGSIYGKWEFDTVDEDVLDALCEFINVSNGLFAREEGENGVVIDMIPPEMHTEKTVVSSEGVYYKIPFYVSDNKLDIIVSMGTKWNIQG